MIDLNLNLVLNLCGHVDGYLRVERESYKKNDFGGDVVSKNMPCTVSVCSSVLVSCLLPHQ